MKKFISTIGYIVFVVVLVIIGILGIIGYTNQESLAMIADSLTMQGAIMVAMMVGGFGGAIACTVFGLANFFKEKTKKIS